MLPEEHELARLESEQGQLEESVASAELHLETTKVELARFQHHYYQTVGRLYAELDDIEARIAGKLADASPEDEYAQEHAEAAQEKARKSAEEAGLAETTAAPPPEITPELKQVFRKAAMLMHPDRATTDSERLRRNVLMAKVNRAYKAGDQMAIEKLVTEFGLDPEAITGEDVGARMIKVIRRIAQLRRRLAEIQPLPRRISLDHVDVAFPPRLSVARRGAYRAAGVRWPPCVSVRRPIGPPQSFSTDTSPRLFRQRLGLTCSAARVGCASRS